MSSPPAKPVKIGWLEALSPRYLKAPSVLVLIAANLLPLAGVLFWGWDLLDLMLLYWAETGIIGFFAIIHMAILARWGAIFYVPFFILHFGGFMFGHFLFLVELFGSGSLSHRLEDIPGTILSVIHERGLWLALGALFISHGISFALNVLRPLGKEGLAMMPQSRNGAPAAMFGVYGRIFVMHVTLLIGAMLAELFGSKVIAFVLLIVLKIAVDVSAHVRKNFLPAR